MKRTWLRCAFVFGPLGFALFGTACAARQNAGLAAETPAPDPAPAVAQTHDSESTVLAEFLWDGQTHRITLGQLEQEVSELPDYRQDDYEGKEGRAEYLTLMAESRVLLERARELLLDKEADIREKVEEYRRQIMLDTIEQEEVDAQVAISEADALAYYEGHQEDYLIPEQVRLTCITLTDKEKAEQVLQEVLAGRDIQDAAREFSQQGLNVGPGGTNDGNTGLFARTTYAEADAFIEKAFAMSVGETTQEPFLLNRRGQDYYMVFRVEEHNQPRQQTFEEVKDSARGSAERERRDAREEEWHGELNARAKLVVYTDRVPNARYPKPEQEGESEGATEPTEEPEPSVSFDDVDAALVLAEYEWNAVPTAYRFEHLRAAFDDLSEYRQDRYAGREGLTDLLNEQLLERLQLVQAQERGFGSRAEDTAKLDEYRHQLMVEKLVQREVDDSVRVGEEDIVAYYDGHASEYVEPEKVRLTCLTFTDEQEAQTTLEEVLAGRDIAEAAQTLSDMGKNLGPGGGNNGDTGLFSRDTYANAAAFTENAFALAEGEITPEVVRQPLQGADYFMIFRVEEKAPPRQQTLEEVREDVSDAVERQKKRQRLEEWLAELTQRSTLRIYAERLPDYPEPQPEPSAADEEPVPDQNPSGDDAANAEE